MEWRAMDKSKTNIAGNSPLQSVQRAWRSILPEFSFLLEFVHMEERKTRLLSTQKTGQDGWDVISSPCLINKRSRFRWGFYVRDDVDWRNGIELAFIFFLLFFSPESWSPRGKVFSTAFADVDSFCNMGRAALVQHFYNCMDEVPLLGVH